MEPSENSALEVGKLNETGWLSDANPGLRVRFAAPLGAFPGGATWLEPGRRPPLREMTSAACGVGRDSIAHAFAVGCPVSPFFASTVQLGVLPGEERAHPARPVGGIWCSCSRTRSRINLQG
ncbi:MAG: hypothetical protein DRQ48_10775 [Gammaproteobacteria bacterium]|nr:MAG: hypothetical protein DRQ48_10775 [Gammaproteobacteria bacterium]